MLKVAEWRQVKIHGTNFQVRDGLGERKSRSRASPGKFKRLKKEKGTHCLACGPSKGRSFQLS